MTMRKLTSSLGVYTIVCAGFAGNSNNGVCVASENVVDSRLSPLLC